MQVGRAAAVQMHVQVDQEQVVKEIAAVVGHLTGQITVAVVAVVKVVAVVPPVVGRAV